MINAVGFFDEEEYDDEVFNDEAAPVIHQNGSNGAKPQTDQVKTGTTAPGADGVDDGMDGEPDYEGETLTAGAIDSKTGKMDPQ